MSPRRAATAPHRSPWGGLRPPRTICSFSARCRGDGEALSWGFTSSSGWGNAGKITQAGRSLPFPGRKWRGEGGIQPRSLRPGPCLPPMLPSCSHPQDAQYQRAPSQGAPVLSPLSPPSRGNVPVPSLSTHGGSPGCSHRCGSKPGDVPSICSRSALVMGAKFRVPACQAALGPLLSPCKACGRRGTRLQVGKCWQAGCELRPVLPALPRHRRQK